MTVMSIVKLSIATCDHLRILQMEDKSQHSDTELVAFGAVSYVGSALLPQDVKFEYIKRTPAENHE